MEGDGVEDLSPEGDRRWLLVPEYHSGVVRAWAIVLVVGFGVMTVGTFVLTSALGEEPPSLEPLGTTAVVLLGFVLLYWVWRRATVGNAYVALGADALVVRAGFTVDLRVPYTDMLGVNPPPVPLVHWEGLVGFHWASQALRVGAGADCVEVVLKAPHAGGGVRIPSTRFSRLWLGVRDPLSFAEALTSKIDQHS